MNEHKKRKLDLDPEELDRVWATTLDAITGYPARASDLPVFPRVVPDSLRESLETFDFSRAESPESVLDFVLAQLDRSHMHTASPHYFGVFNPVGAPMGVVGETLASAFNAQLASYPSAPFLIEMEQHLIRVFGKRFGYSKGTGTFTSGGTEANLTSVLTALHDRFPQIASDGVFAVKKQPRIYLSEEGHHSFEKSARITGLGVRAVRRIPVDADLKMKVSALRNAIREDRAQGFEPLLVVATVGTTNAGVVDPIAPIGEVALSEGLRLHLDAAWGGAAALLPEFESLFEGSEKADSITLDAHKWLNIPMTAGMYLTRHAGELEKTFRVDTSHYMPPSSTRSEKHQPYAESLGWSRRSLGLKLFMVLATSGFEGYRETLRHQIDMGALLRSKLEGAGWEICNSTPLPVVCFRKFGADVERIARDVAESGESWVTTVRLASGVSCLRAGISNYRTEEEHLDRLVRLLGRKGSHA